MSNQRQTYRLPLHGEGALPARLQAPGKHIGWPVRVTTLSLGGAGIEMAPPGVELEDERELVLHVLLAAHAGVHAFGVSVRHVRAHGSGVHVGLQFVHGADPVAAQQRDDLLRAFIMERQREALARRSGLARRLER